MCGIAGVLTAPTEGTGRLAVERIMDEQHSRGPDHRGVETIAAPPHRLIVGHNRLAIVDLSPGSNQPLWDPDHRCCIVFNGEVYNYRDLRGELVSLGQRFETAGDTEVILAAFKQWGTEAFRRLNGMFAFALYDRDTSTLYLVRDRFGVKPLYYRLSESGLSFASTAEPIAREHGLEPNLPYLARGLSFWIYEDDDTAPFLGMQALVPGHYLAVHAEPWGGLRSSLQPFYSLRERVEQVAAELAGASEPQLLSRLEELIEKATQLRIRVEVPVAFSVSGGLDSSALAAMTCGRLPVVGFTFGHPDDPLTEAAMVQQLVRATGLHVNYVYPSMDEIVRAYHATLEAQGAPFPTGSVVAQYLVYKAVSDAGFRVVLGGQGGDEAFMGYRKFQLFHLRWLLHRRRVWEAMGFLLSVTPDLFADMPRLGWYWRLRHRYTRSSGLTTALDLPMPMRSRLDFDPSQPLWTRQYEDIRHASLPTLLRYEDRNSMAHSIESRLPFMDYSAIEFALALPVSAKLKHGYRKWILREVVRGQIPESIRMSRYKRSFDVAQSHWIRRGLGESMRQALRAEWSTLRPYTRSGADVDQLFTDDRLCRDPITFSEVTTLLWLARVGREPKPSSRAA